MIVAVVSVGFERPKYFTQEGAKQVEVCIVANGTTDEDILIDLSFTNGTAESIFLF